MSLSTERIEMEVCRVRDEQPDRVALLEGVAGMLGVDSSTEFELAVVRQMIMAQQAAPVYAEGVGSEQARIGAGFVQGIAFAVAILRLKGAL